MASRPDMKLVARIRRLAGDGAVLYLQFGAADLRALGLVHGQQVELDLGSVAVTGIVKTSGSTAWLAPGVSSNAEITRRLRDAGFEHGQDSRAVVRLIGSNSVSTTAAASNQPMRRTPTTPTDLSLDVSTAVRAVRAYNAGTYRGRTNLDVDRVAYDRFRHGLPRDREGLVDAIRFVGEDYGGAQARFLPHGYAEEAALIAANLLPVIDEYSALVAGAAPLTEVIPSTALLASLLEPFEGTKRWPVWASKTLHFLRPDAFPILDSRAKAALGLTNLGSSAPDYARFCSAIRAAIDSNRDALEAARLVDDGASPSVLKLLDKLLYQLGAATPGPRAASA